MIQEHKPIPYNSFEFKSIWMEGMRLPAQSKGLDRWFFRWQWGTASDIDDVGEWEQASEEQQAGYYASYVIGAQWFDREKKTMPLVVTTKYGCDRVDFLSMFSQCLSSGISADEFSRIYEVDMEQPRIEAPELNSALSPLIIVHFLIVLRGVVKRGLKKDYVQIEEELGKVKGRINRSRNERCNIMRRRYDKVSCKYQEYSENIPENRLLKKALLFSKQMLHHSAMSQGLVSLRHTVNLLLSSFHGIDDEIELQEVRSIKQHKLFKEYNEAIKLARTILKRYDYSITNITTAEEQYCPVFWLDMSLLYEHYVLSLLREAYGDKIKYQMCGYTGRPDFISEDPKIIMDTKYIPRFQKGKIDTAVARQLSAYARDRRLFEHPSQKIIPCVVIYPEEGEVKNPFKGRPLADIIQHEDKYLQGFYRVAVPLPTLDR